MELKSRISTPLEAGTSILDVHRLPSYLVPAIEYTSKRLAEKGLCITLVVARRDYQLPALDSRVNHKTTALRERSITNLPSPPCSPASTDVVLAGGASLNAIKALVRSGSQQNLANSGGRAELGRLGRSKTGSLSKKPSLASLFDGSLGSPRLRWTSTTNNGSHWSKAPRTPATPASCITTTSTASSVVEGALGAQGPDVRLIHTASLAPWAYKLVAATLARASRKFNLHTTLTAHEPSAYSLPSVVLHSSILQNEVLHLSEGMTLLSLDHLYTFKTALGHYAANRSEPSSDFRLEDAVDELRRYVLSSTAGRRRLLKSTLVQAYDWLGPVDDAALAEVTRMYSRAYGTATDMGVYDDLVKITDNGSTNVFNTCASPERSQDACASTGTSFSASTPTPTPPSPMLVQYTVADDYSPLAHQSTVDESREVSAKSSADGHVDGAIDAIEEEQVLGTETDGSGDKTPVPSNKTTFHTTPAPKASPPIIPQNLPRLSPPQDKVSTPKSASRPSAPSLKLQTNFPTVHKPTPMRKKTPVPSRRPSHTKTYPVLPTPFFLSTPASSCPIETGICIELISPADSDTDESLRTDFEDADLMARSPAKTPGGSIWLGIDDILSGDGCRDSRWSSDNLFLQTPAGDKLGPMTPNGYEDISPVTRGEWGFLMVGESFRTRTAGVSCV